MKWSHGRRRLSMRVLVVVACAVGGAAAAVATSVGASPTRDGMTQSSAPSTSHTVKPAVPTGPDLASPQPGQAVSKPEIAASSVLPALPDSGQVMPVASGKVAQLPPNVDEGDPIRATSTYETTTADGSSYLFIIAGNSASDATEGELAVWWDNPITGASGPLTGSFTVADSGALTIQSVTTTAVVLTNGSGSSYTFDLGDDQFSS